MRNFNTDLSKVIFADLLSTRVGMYTLTVDKNLSLPELNMRNAVPFLESLKIAKATLNIDEAIQVAMDERVYGVLVKSNNDLYNVLLLDKIRNAPYIKRDQKVTTYIYFVNNGVDLSPKKNVWTSLFKSLRWKKLSADDASKISTYETYEYDFLVADKFLRKIETEYTLRHFDSIVADTIVHNTTMFPWYSVVISNVVAAFGHPNKSGSTWCFGSAPRSKDPHEVQRTANLDSSFTHKVLPTCWADIVRGVKAMFVE